MDKMVYGQNGIRIKWYWTKWYGQSGIRKKWYSFIFCEHLKSVEFTIHLVSKSHKFLMSTERKAKGVKLEAG